MHVFNLQEDAGGLLPLLLRIFKTDQQVVGAARRQSTAVVLAVSQDNGRIRFGEYFGWSLKMGPVWNRSSNAPLPPKPQPSAVSVLLSAHLHADSAGIQ